MSDTRDFRTEAHRLIDQLPADATWEDLLWAISVRQAVDDGIADAHAGRVHSHDAVAAMVRERFRSAS